MIDRIRNKIIARVQRSVRRFARRQEGAAAVEFAFIAAPFLALMFAILETGLVFFAGQTLENAVSDSARLIMTGQAQTAGWSQDDYKTQVCQTFLSVGLFDCANGVYINVKTYTSFAAVNNSAPVTNGVFDTTKMNYSPGGPGLYRRGHVLLSMADLRDVLRRQPYQSQRRQPSPGGDVGIPQRTLWGGRGMLKTSIIGWLSRFARDRSGVSAVEFAFVAPVMIGLYLGCAEISDGVAADRKVSLIAGALSNLSAQVTTISTADMTNILDASTAIIAPFSAANLTMTVSCLKLDANGGGDSAVERHAERHGARRPDRSIHSTPRKRRWRCRIRGCS